MSAGQNNLKSPIVLLKLISKFTVEPYIWECAILHEDEHIKSCLNNSSDKLKFDGIDESIYSKNKIVKETTVFASS